MTAMVTIHCDQEYLEGICRGRFDSTAATVEAAHLEARRYGWTAGGTRDLCPYHSPRPDPTGRRRRARRIA